MMNNDKDLQSTLKELKREILELKTAKKAGLLLKTFVFYEEEYFYGTGLHKITYEDGIQPIIMTRPQSSANLTFFTPEGNEQYFYWASNGVLGSLTIHATRKVVSVEYISP